MPTLYWSVLLGLALVLHAHGDLRITEVLTCNSGSYVDAHGETPDWIELQWQGVGQVDLSAYTLRCDEKASWRFPKTTLSAGEHLLVLASGQEGWVEGELHAPFRLPAEGGRLQLSGPRDQVVELPGLPADISYGVAEASLLAEPTPGETNAEPIEPGPEQPAFSRPRGFVSGAFDLEISSPAGTRIRYTLDGSAPNLHHGEAYTAPLVIEETTVVRAVCFSANTLPSRVSTVSYLFPQDILDPTSDPPRGWPTARRINRQRMFYGMEAAVNVAATHEDLARGLQALPSISLVLDLEDLLGESSGIYTHAVKRGRAWERSVSMELDRSGESEQALSSRCWLAHAWWLQPALPCSQTQLSGNRPCRLRSG